MPDTFSLTSTALRVGVVATGPRAKTELAPLFGLSSATFDRFLHDLFSAGLVRRSGKGGGRAAVPLDDVEWARIILALTSQHPTGSAVLVSELQNLSSLMSWPPAVGGGSLLTDLSGLIGRLTRAMRDSRDFSTIVPDGWSLTISSDPLVAWMTWPAGGQYFRAVDENGDEIISDPPLIQRLAVVSKAALVAVARLCASDGERSGILVEPPGSASARKTKAAEAPPSTAPADRKTDKPAVRRTAAPHRSQDTLPHQGASTAEAFANRNLGEQSRDSRKNINFASAY
jgi:hypothetical protein